MEQARPTPPIHAARPFTARKPHDLPALWDEEHAWINDLPAVPNHSIDIDTVAVQRRNEEQTRSRRQALISTIHPDVALDRARPTAAPDPTKRERRAQSPIKYPEIANPATPETPIPTAAHADERMFFNPLLDRAASRPPSPHEPSLTTPLLEQARSESAHSDSKVVQPLSLHRDRDSARTCEHFLEERAMAHELEALQVQPESEDRHAYHTSVAKILRATARNNPGLICDLNRKSLSFIYERAFETVWRENPQLHLVMASASDREALRLFLSHGGQGDIRRRQIELLDERNYRGFRIGAAALGETAVVGAALALAAPPLAPVVLFSNAAGAQAVALKFYLRMFDESTEALRPTHAPE